MNSLANGRGRPSPVEVARERHRLADVAVRTGIVLGTLSRTVTVHCPMASHGHPDRTPSMRLYLDDDRYYCFGCGAKGDVVQWVRDAEGLSLGEAIAALDGSRHFRNAWQGQYRESPGRRVRATSGEPPDPARTPPGRVWEVLAAAWDIYSAPVRHDLGRRYLAVRGVDVTVLEAVTGRSEVGHTPEGRNTLSALLQAKGFRPTELVDAGLARRRAAGEGLADVYRERVLFPLRDELGRVRGFVGRNVGDQRWAKYLNPTRTAVYDKALHLYRPLPAPAHACGHIVVVEGIVDAIAVAVAAIGSQMSRYVCPLTQSGRELSPRQVAAVLTLHSGIPVIALDGDAAGREGAQRMEQAFRAAGRKSLKAILPEGEDPASWLAVRGFAGLREVLGKSPRRVHLPPSEASAAVSATGTPAL